MQKKKTTKGERGVREGGSETDRQTDRQTEAETDRNKMQSNSIDDLLKSASSPY